MIAEYALKYKRSKESVVREYGYDVYGLIDAIKKHTAWKKSLPTEQAEAIQKKEMIEAGIWDENGELTAPYCRTEW